MPEGWFDVLLAWNLDQSVATRTASGRVLDALAPVLPELWGGSADLGASNHTTMAGEPSFLPAALAQSEGDGPFGRTLHFGVREHAMGSILNGIALDGLTRPYGGTFMVFSDYMRPAVRLAALMGIGPIFVWSHDSIGVGEEAPPTSPSSTSPPCGPSRASTSSAPPTPTRPPPRGRRSSGAATSPPA